MPLYGYRLQCDTWEPTGLHLNLFITRYYNCNRCTGRKNGEAERSEEQPHIVFELAQELKMAAKTTRQRQKVNVNGIDKELLTSANGACTAIRVVLS